MADTLWTITELQRTGAGTLQEDPEGARFVWDGPGHSMPYSGVELTRQVNTVRTVYPGTELPVEQVLSTEYPPIDIAGAWDDKFNFPGFAADQERAMDAMVSRGSLVRMDYQQFSLTGILTRSRIQLRHQTRIEWGLTFSVHFRDSQQSTARNGQVISAGARPMREAATATEDAVLSLELAQEVGQTVLQAVPAFPLSNAVVDQSRTVQDAVNVRASQGLTAASEEELRTQRERYATLQTTGTQSAALLAATRSIEATSFDSVTQRLGFELWSRGVRTNGRVMVDRSARAQADIDLVLTAQTRSVIRPAVGASVYQVAASFADVPEGWRAIAIANNLTELVFDGRTNLVVPVERTV